MGVPCALRKRTDRHINVHGVSVFQWRPAIEQRLLGKIQSPDRYHRAAMTAVVRGSSVEPCGYQFQVHLFQLLAPAAATTEAVAATSQTAAVPARNKHRTTASAHIVYETTRRRCAQAAGRPRRRRPRPYPDHRQRGSRIPAVAAPADLREALSVVRRPRSS